MLRNEAFEQWWRRVRLPEQAWAASRTSRHPTHWQCQPHHLLLVGYLSIQLMLVVKLVGQALRVRLSVGPC
jgi:hypothetical protein